MLAFLLRYPDGFGVAGADGQGVVAEDFTRSENRLIFETLLEIERAGGQFSDIEEKLAPELLTHLATLQVYIQGEPELTDLYSVQEAMRFQLNRLREQKLRRLYEQGSKALEEETLTDNGTAGEEDAEAQAELWQLISGVAARLKVYYPKPSPIFRDSRNR